MRQLEQRKLAQSTQRATASSFLCLQPVQRGVAGWNVSIWSELKSKLFKMPSIDSVLQRGHTSLLRSKQRLQKVWKQDSSFGSETGSLHCWQCSSEGSLSRSTESLAGGEDPLTDRGESSNGERDR